MNVSNWESKIRRDRKYSLPTLRQQQKKSYFFFIFDKIKSARLSTQWTLFRETKSEWINMKENWKILKRYNSSYSKLLKVLWSRAGLSKNFRTPSVLVWLHTHPHSKKTVCCFFCFVILFIYFFLCVRYKIAFLFFFLLFRSFLFYTQLYEYQLFVVFNLFARDNHIK